MAGCLDHCRLPEWECFDKIRESRNTIASAVSGTLFGIAWWMVADAAAQYPDQNDFPKAAHTCGVVSTISLIMVNAVSNSQVRGESADGCLGSIGAKIWLFTGFLLGFSALIASSWILFDLFVVNIGTKPSDWPGVAIFLQNVMIFFSTLLFKFGRSEDLWDN